MSFNEIQLQNNNIIRNMGHLLSQIDPRVRWVDYVPGNALTIGHSLVLIGFNNNNIKYVDVSDNCDRLEINVLRKDLSPFKLVNRVLNAMDDYHLEVQFMNKRQLSYIVDDIALLAKERAAIAKKTADILRYEIKDCMPIISKAQKLGIFPNFFPKNIDKNDITGDILADFIENCRATFIDTQIVSELVEEQIKIEEMEKDTDELELE